MASETEPLTGVSVPQPVAATSTGSRLAMLSLPALAFLTVWLLPMETSPAAHRLAAVLAAVVVAWITESLPLPVTAMLGAALIVVLKIAPAKEVFAPFADPLMFLFIGGFMLAEAIFRHGLDRRLAFGVLTLPIVGARPVRILFAFGLVTAVLSAWISNTATTAMMFAIGLSLLTLLEATNNADEPRLNPRYATSLMLMTSFAASIGGLATPIGTPPNLIGLSLIRESLQVEISFFKWMMMGVPIVGMLFLFMFVYFSILCPAGIREVGNVSRALRSRESDRGPWTTGQKSTLAVFAIVVVLWLTPGIVGLVVGDTSPTYKSLSSSLPEGVAALLAASLLFVLPGGRGRPVLTWTEASRIDWGVVLLYGGGLALGMQAEKTGLASYLGTSLAQRLPIDDPTVFMVMATLLATLVSEATSNTASANIVVPVVLSLARAQGIDPLEPAVAATFGSSLGFMMPVSTPCNAIVYSSGRITLRQMMSYGLLLDIAGVVVITTVVRFVLPFVR